MQKSYIFKQRLQNTLMGMKGSKKIRKKFNKLLERARKHPLQGQRYTANQSHPEKRYFSEGESYRTCRTAAPHIGRDFRAEYKGIEYINSISIGGLTTTEAMEIVPQVKDLVKRVQSENTRRHVLVNYTEGENVRQAYLEITKLGTLRWPLLTDRISMDLYANVYGKTDNPEKIRDFHKVY